MCEDENSKNKGTNVPVGLLIKRYSMGWRVSFLQFLLTLAVDGDRWLASCPGRLNHGEKATDTLDKLLGGPLPVMKRKLQEKFLASTVKVINTNKLNFVRN
jgi:hypothetical protein